MKKMFLVSLLLACSMAIMVGCNNNDSNLDVNNSDNISSDISDSDMSSTDETGDTSDEVVDDETVTDIMSETSSVDLIQNAWDLMEEDNKFPCFGGSIENSVDGGAGEVQISDTNMLINTLLVPDDVQKCTVEVASLVHMMNTNTFTSAAIKLDGMDAEEAADKICDSFMNTQFMCGVPEKISLAVCGDYVVYAYGEAVNVDNFMNCLNSVYVPSKVIDKKY